MHLPTVFKEADLRPHFVVQPIVPAMTGLSMGIETLLRVTDRSGKIASLSGFLGVAQLSGRITEVDVWVVNAVVDWLSEGFSPGIPNYFVSINVDATSFCNPEFIDFLMRRVTDAALNKRICLEITESSAIRNNAAARSHIQAVQAQGIRVALDDFGAGYMSYLTLKLLPASIVKIDGSVVGGIANDVRSQSIVDSIVNLAHELGAKAVAEKVESAEDFACLQEMDVDYFQGYYLGEPVSPNLFGSQSLNYTLEGYREPLLRLVNL